MTQLCGGQHLERDRLAGEAIARAVHLAHPADARDALDLDSLGDDGSCLHQLRRVFNAAVTSAASTVAPLDLRCFIAMPIAWPSVFAALIASA